MAELQQHAAVPEFTAQRASWIRDTVLTKAMRQAAHRRDHHDGNTTT